MAPCTQWTPFSPWIFEFLDGLRPLRFRETVSVTTFPCRKTLTSETRGKTWSQREGPYPAEHLYVHIMRAARQAAGWAEKCAHRLVDFAQRFSKLGASGVKVVPLVANYACSNGCIFLSGTKSEQDAKEPQDRRQRDIVGRITHTVCVAKRRSPVILKCAHVVNDERARCVVKGDHCGHGRYLLRGAFVCERLPVVRSAVVRLCMEGFGCAERQAQAQK